MEPADRLDEASKQTQIVLDDALLSEDDAAAIRNARRRINRVRDRLRTRPEGYTPGADE